MNILHKIKVWLSWFKLRVKGLYLPEWKPSEKQVTPNEVRDGLVLRKYKKK